MRAYVGGTLKVAENDKGFAQAIARLIEAAHLFNRWEPDVRAFDDLCEAAEEYVHERKRVIVRLREE